MPVASGSRHAVILSGGGAYSAYEVGVLKALLKGEVRRTGFAPVDPEIYAGTSAGGINAAVMVSQDGLGVPPVPAVAFLERAWVDAIAEAEETCGNGAYRIRADPFRYLRPQCLAEPARALAELGEDAAHLATSLVARTLDFLSASGNVPTRALQFVDLSAFVSGEPMSRLVGGLISLEAIRGSRTALRMVAVNWAPGEARMFGNGDLTDDEGYNAVLASAAIPGFFPPRYVGGQPYVDGAVAMNTPLRAAIDAGGDVLHVVYLDPDIAKLPLRVLQNTYATLDRTIVIHNATIINEDIAVASWINDGLTAMDLVLRGDPPTDAAARDFVRVAARIADRLRSGTPYRKLTIHRYHPHSDLGGGFIGILNFDRDRVVRLIDQGYEDTVSHDCAQSSCILPS